MNKIPKTLIGFLAASVLLCGAFVTTGCETLEKAKADYPITYTLLKGGAEVYLTNYLATTDDSLVVENREALLGATRAVFAENEDPRDVGLALSDKLAGIYPDEPETREAILRNLAAVLRPDADTPASAADDPQRQYNADLADTLAPEPVGSAPAAEVDEPPDYSLGGWLRSYPFDPEYRKSLRAHYAKPDPEQAEKARKLRALMQATDPESGNVDHEVYRKLAL